MSIKEGDTVVFGGQYSARVLDAEHADWLTLKFIGSGQIADRLRSECSPLKAPKDAPRPCLACQGDGCIQVGPDEYEPCARCEGSGTEHSSGAPGPDGE